MSAKTKQKRLKATESVVAGMLGRMFGCARPIFTISGLREWCDTLPGNLLGPLEFYEWLDHVPDAVMSDRLNDLVLWVDACRDSVYVMKDADVGGPAGIWFVTAEDPNDPVAPLFHGTTGRMLINHHLHPDGYIFRVVAVQASTLFRNKEETE